MINSTACLPKMALPTYFHANAAMTLLPFACWRTPVRPYRAIGLLLLSLLGLAQWLSTPVEGNEECRPFARLRRTPSAGVGERAFEPRENHGGASAKADDPDSGFLVK